MPSYSTCQGDMATLWAYPSPLPLQRHDSLSLAHRRLSMGQDLSQAAEREHKDEHRVSRPSLLNQTLTRSQGVTCHLLAPCLSLKAFPFADGAGHNMYTPWPLPSTSATVDCAGSLKAVLRSMVAPFAAAAPKPVPLAREAAAHPLQSALRSSISQRRSTSAQFLDQGEGELPGDESGAGQALRKSYSLRRSSTVRFFDEQEVNSKERRTTSQS